MEGERGRAKASARAAPTLAASVLGAGAAGALVIVRHPVWAGLMALAATVALVWGWFFAHQGGDPRSHLAAMLADPVFDTTILGALAWAARGDDTHLAVLALVCLGLSYLASYQRARSDALGYRTFEGLGYRVGRAAFLVAGLVSGELTAALWLFAALCAIAAGARAANVALQERRAARAKP